MPNLNELIEEVKLNLQGYTLNQDKLTYVANTSGITATDTAIQVGSAAGLAKGTIEIDDELIYVDSFDKATNTLNVIPSGFGRGYQGTVAATHARYARVILAPMFPRIAVKRAINDTIQSFFPKLWGTASTTITFDGTRTTYQLPADFQSLISASWESVGSSKEWIPVGRVRIDPMANTGAYPSGNTISLYDPITPGRTVQIFYSKEPTQLENNGDDFTTVTGLPASVKDVVVLGASYRLLSYVDSGRLNLTSAEADSADTRIPSNAGASAARYIYALYQQRLNEEAGKLQGKYPVRVTYNR